MSRKFLTNIDLTKNELQNARVQNLGTAPSSPVEGQLYYDTATKRFMIRNDSTWVECDNDTAAQLLTKILTVDGAASGLDADLLDGQHGSHYLDRANHSGTQLAATVSDFDTQVRTSRLDQMAAPNTSVSFNSQKLTNVATPTSGTDGVNKDYADSLAAGLDPKASCRVATTEDITLSGTQTIDGVSVIAGDRVLVKDQDAGEENGIWVCAAGAWSRATDADVSAEVTAGMFTFIEEGTLGGDTGWTLSTNNAIVLGTTELVFVQFSSAGIILAGAGLTKTGSTIDVIGTASRITVNADSIDIASDYVGQTSITTLGTVTTGTWSGTTIALNKGGTGATDQAGAATALGVGTGDSPQFTAVNIGHATDTTITRVSAGLIAVEGNTVLTAATGQPLDPTLTALAALTIAANSLTIGTGADAFSQTTFAANTFPARASTGSLVAKTITDFALTLLDDADAPTVRATVGATGKYSATIGDNSSTSIAITQVTHGLATDGQMIAACYDVSTGAEVIPDITINNSNGTVTFGFAVAPTTNQYRVVIMG